YRCTGCVGSTIFPVFPILEKKGIQAMIVVDSQIHPWSEGTSTGHHQKEPIDEHVLCSDMKNAGVDRAVLVPPLWDPNGNAYALSLTRKFPEKFCVMGLLDPRQPDAAAQLY